MAMRDADKDRNKNRSVKKNSYTPATEPASLHELKQFLMNARAKCNQLEKLNEETVSQLNQAQQEIETYQNEINELRERAAQSYEIYQNEQKVYQQVLSLYNREKAKAGELISQRDRWQQQAKENEEATSKLIQVKQSVQTYGIKIKELEDKISENYLLYINEQEKSHEATSQLVGVQQNIQIYEIEVDRLKQLVAHEKQNYQQTFCLYEEEKTKTIELLAKYEEVTSDRDKYVILYNETQTQLKFERRSKASIKGWETRRKAENERLKQEISEMVVLLRESLTSKDEAINNLYVVAERMDRIQSLVDLVDEETTSSPVGMVQKFKRIWLAVKEILSE